MVIFRVEMDKLVTINSWKIKDYDIITHNVCFIKFWEMNYNSMSLLAFETTVLTIILKLNSVLLKTSL